MLKTETGKLWQNSLWMHCEAQSEAEHKKVIIAGDFNADPFEEVMLKANYFHALPYADIVENKRERDVYGKTIRCFITPCGIFLVI